MTEYEKALKLVLAEHSKWVSSQDSGTRLDLTSTDLRGADLRGADMRSADLHNANLEGAYLSRFDLDHAFLYPNYPTRSETIRQDANPVEFDKSSDDEGLSPFQFFDEEPETRHPEAEPVVSDRFDDFLTGA
jgi:hypothetical protein